MSESERPTPTRLRVAPAVAELPDLELADILRAIFDGGAVDLALGIPEFEPPEAVKRAAIAAIDGGHNQYQDSWGVRSLRAAVAAVAGARRAVELDADREVTITAGATEANYIALATMVGPGDEVVLFEPFFAPHLQTIRVLGGRPRIVRLRPPDWSFDDAELDAAFGSRTRAVMLNTPHNPTGKIFSADELDRIGQRCLRWNTGIVCDEIYDAFVYDGHAFCSPLQLDPLRERVVVAGGLSKSLRISGWRIGFALAGPSLSAQLRKVHDLVSLCVPVPFQHAAAAVLRDQGCVDELVARYGRQRDRVIEMLESVGLRCYPAPGSIYLMCDGQRFNLPTGQDLASLLAVQAGVAFTPGRTCFMDPAEGRYLLRACFAKQDATLALAKERLGRFFAGSPLAS